MTDFDELEPDEFDDGCDSVFGGEFCCLEDGHEGDHINRRCDATCDTCNCATWTDDDLEAGDDEDSYEDDDFDELDENDPRSGNWVP